MKTRNINKERFKLNKGFRFKGEQKTLKIRAGTISKLQKNSTFGSTNKKVKIIAEGGTKRVPSSFTSKKKQEELRQNKKVYKQKKDTNKKRTNVKIAKSNGVSSFNKSVAKFGTKHFVYKSLSALDQEDSKESQSFKGTIRSSSNMFDASKKVHKFMTKEEKFSKSVSVGKLDDMRFLGASKGKKSVNHVIDKSVKKKSVYQAKQSLKKSIIQGFNKAVSTIMTSNPFSWLIVAITTLILILVGIIFVATNQSNSSSGNGSMYVKHWDGNDAYHSSLLAQRYGITAEQIDGFIKNEGYTQVDERATGKEFLRLQSVSGIDVRMLVAFAQMESSYGTAGVAKQFPKANIFGYGAFDNDPNQGASWDNTRAVNEFRSTQIDSFGNTTIAIMDDRARAYHNNTLLPGQYVYWTALDAGVPRAQIAEKLDKWIDEHGGTPDPPGGYGSVNGGGGAGLSILDQLLGQTVSGEYGGLTGQCYAVTAYYAHSITPEIILRGGVKASEIGNDYNWSSWKWTVVKNPDYKDMKAGDIVNFAAGANMGTWVADGTYGHTGVVGQVLGNNQFILYDQNPGPLKTWTVTYVPGGISSIIHPPK